MPVIRGRGGTGLLTALSARKKPKGPSAAQLAAQGGSYLSAQHARFSPTPGTPQGARAAAKFAAPMAKREAFEERRLQLERELALRVNAGVMTQAQAHRVLQRAGFVPGGSAYREPKGVGGAAAKAIGATAGVGEAVGRRVVKGLTPRNTVASTPGHVVTPAYVKAHPHAIYQVDKQGRPVLPDVGAGFVSPGTGLLAQTATGLAQSATYNPGGLEQAIVHPGRTAEHVARNLEHTVRHPLSRPDQSALLAFALLSGGGAAGSRIAGAGSALRAGEGAAAAVKRPGHAGGSLLHTPEPGTHPIYVPGAAPESGIGPVPATQVDRLLSRNVVVRNLVQKPRNRRIQRALDKGPAAQQPKTALGRFAHGNLSAEATIGREIRARRRVGHAAAQGPVTAQQRAVHGAFTLGNVSRGENTALQVVAIEGHQALRDPDAVIARHIATHERFIGEGRDVGANRAMIRDLKLARAALLNPSEKFKAALQHTYALSADTEAQLIAAGHLTAETAEARKANIAALYHGGRYEASTPGKLGKPSQSLLRQRAEVERLQVLHDRATTTVKAAGEKAAGPQDALIGNRVVGAGAERLSTAKGAVRDAQMRLARLEREHNAALDKIAGAKFGPVDMGEVRFRTVENARARRQAAGVNRAGKASGASGRMSTLRPSVVAERRAHAEKLVDDAIAKNPKDPTVVEWQARRDEIERLRERLNPMIGEGRPTGTVVGPGRVIAPAGATRADRIGAALSVSKDRLAQMEAAAARRVKPTGMIGVADTAPEGSFFYPLSRRFTENVSRTRSGAYSPSPSQAGGIAPPRANLVVNKQPFTGKSVENAQRPISVADAIADRATRTNKLLDQERVYGELWRVATPTRVSEHQIPIRDTAQVKSETRKFFAQLHDHLQAHPDEAAALNVNEANTLQQLLDASEHKTAQVGAQIDGVRWVDRRYLKDLGENSVRGPIEKALDAVTNPVRATSLYLRPAYALNLIGNATMQAVTQGHLAGSAMKTALRAVRTDGAENVALVDSLVGASNSRAFSVNTGVMGKANQQLAEAWNALTDLQARRSAFYHEAAKAGFKTAEQRAALLRDKAHARKLVEVTRRANKNMVDFASMTPLEKNTIRRVIYYYPWMSRATIWSLRTLVEHPGKAFTLAQLAQVGAENAHRKIGEMPAWAEQLGLIPVGDAEDGKVSVLNPSSINTPSTAASLGAAAVGTARAALGMEQGATGLGDVVTPGVGALTGIAGAGGTVPGSTGLRAILEAHPYYGLARRAGLVGEPSATYPDTGLEPALGPFAAGGLFPRHISQAALAKQHAREHHTSQLVAPPSGTPSPGGRERGRVPYRGSVYAQSGSSGGSVYAQKGSSRGSVYAQRGGRVPYRP